MYFKGHSLDIDLLKPGTVHKFSPAGATARNSTAITLEHGGRKIVRIVATANVNIIFGGSAVEAAATDSFLPANLVEYFDMWGDTYVAAIGTADVYVTEMGTE